MYERNSNADIDKSSNPYQNKPPIGYNISYANKSKHTNQPSLSTNNVLSTQPTSIHNSQIDRNLEPQVMALGPNENKELNHRLR